MTKKIEIPGSLINEVRTLENGFTLIYRGTAFGLWFEGADIRGKASLSCVSAIEKPHWTGRREEQEVLWHVEIKIGSPYFISRGYSTTDRSGSWEYRGALVGIAANRGIILSDKLLNAVFGPIDAELLRLYRQVVNG